MAQIANTFILRRNIGELLELGARKVAFFERNEVHSSPLLKHENGFYRVREGDPFGDIFAAEFWPKVLAKIWATISEHQQTITGYLRLRPFDDAEAAQLEQFLFEEACRLEQAAALMGQAREFLKERRAPEPAFRRRSGWRFPTAQDKEELENWLRNQGAKDAHAADALFDSACERLRACGWNCRRKANSSVSSTPP